jgi:hypothetical protein
VEPLAFELVEAPPLLLALLLPLTPELKAPLLLLLALLALVALLVLALLPAALLLAVWAIATVPSRSAADAPAIITFWSMMASLDRLNSQANQRPIKAVPNTVIAPSLY